jgi:uncharacterized protein (TIGR02284 family)
VRSLSPEVEQAKSAIYMVIEELIDSQEALVEIGEKLGDRTLRRFFLTESLKRAQFRNKLEALLNQEGVSEIRKSPSIDSAEHPAWWRLRRSMLIGDDFLLLAKAERSEDTVQKTYANAISAYLPQAIRGVLSTQVAHIQRSRNYVRAALDRANKSAA